MTIFLATKDSYVAAARMGNGAVCSVHAHINPCPLTHHEGRTVNQIPSLIRPGAFNCRISKSKSFFLPTRETGK